MNQYFFNFVFFFVAKELFILRRKEAIDGWHDLRRAGSEELPEAMLFVFLSLFLVVKHSHASVCFVDSATNELIKSQIKHNL